MSSAERMRVGQHITADTVLYPDLKGQRLLITEVIGAGDDAMYAVRNDKGPVTFRRMVRYIKADEALPAGAPDGERPRVVEIEKETVHMNAETKLLNLATTIAKTEGISLARATAKASKQLTAEEIIEYRSGGPALSAAASAKSLNENERPGTMRLRAAADRVAREQGLSADDAVDAILCAHVPDTAASRFAQRVVQLKAGGLNDLAALTTAQREDPTGAEAYRLAGL